MRKKHAVLIGNNYPGTNAELNGCVNDALDWQTLLTQNGYSCDVLVEATLGQAVGALREGVARTGFGDRLVFQYSGHGSWLPDQDGDEADRRDECLVMADYTQGGLLLDDDLYAIFSVLPPGSGCLVLSDSCHSGTVNRAVALNGGKGRFLSPAHFTDLTQDQARLMEQTVSVKSSRPATSLVSGCADLELSYDAWFGNRANGAFSRAALDTYTAGTSLVSWFNRIRQFLPSDHYPQSPQLTAANLYRRYAKAL